jgi:hypothetical protein
VVLSLPVPETMAEVAAAADVETTGELEPLLVPVLPGVPVVLDEGIQEDVVDVDEIVVVDADGELETIALVVAELMLELKNSINNKLE